MSRSYNKYAPLWGSNDQPSDFYFKKYWHKKFRLYFKKRIRTNPEECHVDEREVSDIYSSSKDSAPHRIHKKDFEVYIKEEFIKDYGGSKNNFYYSFNPKREVSAKYKNRK